MYFKFVSGSRNWVASWVSTLSPKLASIKDRGGFAFGIRSPTNKFEANPSHSSTFGLPSPFRCARQEAFYMPRLPLS